ncbi:MAG: PD40 domain-containing protein [Opitutaceae bacterium]|nr:PD40 domain-containing protein [Opitutaceae bacterium]
MAAPNPEGVLVYSLREWDGEYFSRDVPGGVETSPVRSHIRIIAPDGSGDRRLDLPGERAEFPVGSPDGRWIYFQTAVDGRWRICRVRPDGSGLMTIAPPPGPEYGRASAFGAALSSDGRSLTYTMHDGGTGRVALAQADGGGARVLAPEYGHAYMASPDATAGRVVFSGPAQGYRLALVDTAGGAPRVLTPEHPDCYAPQFTPDGQAIIFIRRDGGLYRIAPDGTGLTRLADKVQVEFFLSRQDRHGSTDFPAIAPDGARVAFVSRDAAAGATVCTVAIDGGEVRRLTPPAGDGGRVHWSPDGRWLAYAALAGPRPQLFIVPADGSRAPRRLTDGAAAVYALSWLPLAG